MKPLCFVLMLLNLKPDPGGSVIDFKAVYADLVEPATAEAGFEPLRADEEQVGRNHPQADVPGG